MWPKHLRSIHLSPQFIQAAPCINHRITTYNQTLLSTLQSDSKSSSSLQNNSPIAQSQPRHTSPIDLCEERIQTTTHRKTTTQTQCPHPHPQPYAASTAPSSANSHPEPPQPPPHSPPTSAKPSPLHPPQRPSPPSPKPPSPTPNPPLPKSPHPPVSTASALQKRFGKKWTRRSNWLSI